jgi:hypothetical protein
MTEVGLLGDTDTAGSPPNSKDTDIGLPTALWFLHWHLQSGLVLNGHSCGFDSGEIHESVEGGLNTSTRSPNTNKMSLDSGALPLPKIFKLTSPFL